MAKTAAAPPTPNLPGPPNAPKKPKTGEVGAAPLIRPPELTPAPVAADPEKLDPDATFVFNPQYGIVENARRARISLRGHWLVALLTILIGAVAAALGFLEARHALSQSAEAEARAVLIRAQVVARWTQEFPREVRYWVRYTFQTPDGAWHEGRSAVNADAYGGLTEGGELIVKYLPEAPHESALAYQEIRPAELDFALLLMFVPAGVAVTAVGLSLLIALRNRRYERQGVVIRGEVVTCEAQEGANGFWITLKYAFRTPQGKAITATLRAEREDLREESLPKPGTPVAVLYVSEHLYRLL